MNHAQIREALKACGFKGDIVKTGHQEYERVFVQLNDGGCTSLGRMVIRWGQYQWINWYNRAEGDFWEEIERHQINWEFYVQFTRVITDEQWKDALAKSWQASKDEKAEKEKWRGANAHPQGKRRKALDNPNPRKYIWQFLTERMAPNEPQSTTQDQVRQLQNMADR